MIVLKLLLEGLGLGCMLYLSCVIGLRKGAVYMVHLYDQDVQERVAELGLMTKDEIRKHGSMFRAVCLPVYIVYVLVCVYVLNGTRGFLPGFIQMFVILSVMNLVDRFLIDEYWVGHTKDWIIPGTEDLMPYIKAEDRKKKWLMGTVGMAVLAGIFAAIMSLILK